MCLAHVWFFAIIYYCTTRRAHGCLEGLCFNYKFFVPADANDQLIHQNTKTKKKKLVRIKKILKLVFILFY